jgi:hypothetical protein
VDAGTKFEPKRMPPKLPTPRLVRITPPMIRTIRALSDAKAAELDQIGIRLLKHYHALVRAHAVRHGRSAVTNVDLDFLRAVDRYISITECRPL